MKLSQLLKNVPGAPTALARDPDVTGLTCDSRKVEPGFVFFALPGLKHNGAAFASMATEKGASAILTAEHDVASTSAVVQVPDPRLAMGRMAATFHGHPSAKLKVVGITGTNGKTTTAWLIRHLLEANGRRCGLLGTISHHLGGREIPAAHTTPESTDIQAALAEMVASGCQTCAMEVSSHALVQNRVESVQFALPVFTNLTQDHLDYHRTMDAYFEAKAGLFEQAAKSSEGKAKAVINADDRYGHRLLARFDKRLKLIRYGVSVQTEFRASNIKTDINGTQYRLEAKGREFLVRLPLIGNFNIYNSLAALAAVTGLGVEIRSVVAALADAPQVPGRLQRVPSRRNFQIFVDYAHTDDALAKALRALRDLSPSRLICVFGCGGDRDSAKRPLMGRAAEEGADYSIITTDNPRSEEPEAIIADIRQGLRQSNHEVVTDRERAIFRAAELAGPGDIVLIAGKGHENYQEIQGVRHPFDDVKAATWAMNEKVAAE